MPPSQLHPTLPWWQYPPGLERLAALESKFDNEATGYRRPVCYPPAYDPALPLLRRHGRRPRNPFR